MVPSVHLTPIPLTITPNYYIAEVPALQTMWGKQSLLWYEVLMTLWMKTSIFWDMKPHLLAICYWCF